MRPVLIIKSSHDVSEDQGMIDAVTEGALTLEKLEAMTCVCSVGSINQ